MASMRFGWTPGSVREKLLSRRYGDAMLSWLERKVLYRSQIRRVREAFKTSGQPAFLINTLPLCLTAKYTTDNDAVYFASEAEVSSYLSAQGVDVVLGSKDVVGADRNNALVIARKRQ
jgi:hypothetical protein